MDGGSIPPSSTFYAIYQGLCAKWTGNTPPSTTPGHEGVADAEAGVSRSEEPVHRSWREPVRRVRTEPGRIRTRITSAVAVRRATRRRKCRDSPNLNAAWSSCVPARSDANQQLWERAHWGVSIASPAPMRRSGRFTASPAWARHRRWDCRILAQGGCMGEESATRVPESRPSNWCDVRTEPESCAPWGIPITLTSRVSSSRT